MGRLITEAEKAKVYLNIENIFVNGFLHSPQEMIDFVDGFKSDRVCVHFDTGNIMLYHFPEHWIPALGKRIRNIHFKEYSKKVHKFNLPSFRPLLDGTTNWPAVMEALDKVGYRGYLTFEYFTPFPHWPEALVYQTSDAWTACWGERVEDRLENKFPICREISKARSASEDCALSCGGRKNFACAFGLRFVESNKAFGGAIGLTEE